MLGFDCIQWVDCIKYLGVHVCSGKNLAFDIAPVKRSFYAACSSITVYTSAKSLDELIHLTVGLHESYCLPILTYASAAVSFSIKQLHDSNVCWN